MDTRTKPKTAQQRGRIFRTAREAAGLTIPQCAKKAATSKGMVERYERGTSAPSEAGVLDRMLAAVGLDDPETPAGVLGPQDTASGTDGRAQGPKTVLTSSGSNDSVKKAPKKPTILVLPIERIALNKATPVDADEVARMKDSIDHYTLLNPITVRRVGADFELIAGKVRLAATKATGALTIQAKVVDVDDDEAEAIGLTEDVDRKNFTPAERIRMVGRLKELLSKHFPSGRGGDRKSGAYNDTQKSNGQVGTKVTSLTGELERRMRISKRAVLRKTKIYEDALPQVTDAIGNGIDENDAEQIAALPKDKQLAALAERRKNHAGKKADGPAAPTPPTSTPLLPEPLDIVVGHLAEAAKVMRSIKTANPDRAKLDSVERHLTMLASMARDLTDDMDDPEAAT